LRYKLVPFCTQPLNAAGNRFWEGSRHLAYLTNVVTPKAVVRIIRANPLNRYIQ
jgi:hypothetical protein